MPPVTLPGVLLQAGWLASGPRVSGDLPCVIAGGMDDLSWPPAPGAQCSTEWKVWDLGFAAKGP